MSREETPAYIARCPKCNGPYMAVVDNPENKANVAESISEAVLEGGIIERVTVGYVREHGLTCQCEWLDE